jgi:hypothetical protein
MALGRSAVPVFSHILAQPLHEASRSKRDNYTTFSDTLTSWPGFLNGAGAGPVVAALPVNLLAADHLAQGVVYAMQPRQDKWS